ncbi:hypothetical protein QTP88_024469 [Uroleucon formosanum]
MFRRIYSFTFRRLSHCVSALRRIGRTVENSGARAVTRRGAFSTKITLNSRGRGKQIEGFRPSLCCRTRGAVKGSLRYLNFSGKDTRVRAAAAMTMRDRPPARWKSHRHSEGRARTYARTPSVRVPTRLVCPHRVHAGRTVNDATRQ